MVVPIMQPISREYKWFSRADVDSFFALFMDNMASLIAILGVIATLIPSLTSPSPAHTNAFREMVWLRVCPGIAMSLVAGNVYYAIMAAKLAGYTKRQDVTALPYGINTPAGFVTAYNIILPIAGVYATDDPNISPADWVNKTWQTACAVTFIGGLFEVAGSFIDIRPFMAKTALYSPVAGIGFVWLAMVPLVLVMREPIIGMIPMAIVFTGFFAKNGKGVYSKITGGGAILIVLIGIILKWAGAGKYTGNQDYMGGLVNQAWNDYAGKNHMFTSPYIPGFNSSAGVYWPPSESFPIFPLGYWDDVDKFIAIVIPIAIINFIETLENVEQAKASGDEYNLREAMIADGVGTCIGACFGAILPTTVYIGHRRHKVIGAKAGYSIMNAVAYFVLFMCGIFPTFFYIMDETSINVILMMVGLLIVRQTVEVSHPRHVPALCIGIMANVMDWAVLNANATEIGIFNLAAGGAIMASLIMPAIICDLIDNRYVRASVWSLVAIFFSEVGIMHGNNAVDIDTNAPGGFPFFGQGGNGGSMKVPGQLTFSFKDNKPGWTGGPAFLDTQGNGGVGGNKGCYFPPEFRGLQYTASGGASDGMNEGWRFAVAYGMVFLFCAFHAVLQKIGWLDPPILDDGSNPHAEEYINAHKEEEALGVRTSDTKEVPPPSAENEA